MSIKQRFVSCAWARLVCTSILLMLVALSSTPAWAIRVYPDPWPGMPGTTTNDWDFTRDLYNPVYSDGTDPGQLVDHTGATPGTAMVPTGVFNEFTPGSVWHTGAEGGSLSFLLGNYPDPNWHKLMQIQFTSSKSGVVSVNSPVGPGNVVPGGGAAGHGGGWYTYQWFWEIQPNPQYETVTITFPFDTNVEQVHIDTICEVPEPTTVTLLGSALLGLGGCLFLRRRRS